MKAIFSAILCLLILLQRVSATSYRYNLDRKSSTPIQTRVFQAQQTYEYQYNHEPYLIRSPSVSPRIDLDAPQNVPKPIVPQQNLQSVSARISSGSEKFSYEMFGVIADAVRNYDANFIISPFSVWSLMLLVSEGANNESYAQLAKVLRLPNDLNTVRVVYKQFQRLLLVNTPTIELAVNQAMFSDKNRPVKIEYATTLTSEYEADHLPLDFRNQQAASAAINEHISFRTHGKIQNVVKPDDLSDTQLLLTSAVFFKGQWKMPFNESLTEPKPFYRETGELIGDVPMMYQRALFPYTKLRSLNASVVELPYGKEDRLCMLLLLPFYNVSLTSVFHNLRSHDIARLDYEIHKWDNTNDYDDSDVYLSLPSFNIDSDLELRTVFEDMGITDIFDPAKADLSKLSADPTFVSRIFHKAVIQVNEAGTVASAFTGSTVSFKQAPTEFVFNRPFGFLITDKTTKTLLFAGQVRNPLV